VDIIDNDRQKDDPQARPRPRALPVSDDAWCTVCMNVADLATALVIENRAILCAACVDAVALATADAKRPDPA
jgi:hypothetical protein